MRKGSQGGLSGLGLCNWKDDVAITWNGKITCMMFRGKDDDLGFGMLSLRFVLVTQVEMSGQQTEVQERGLGWR